MKFPLQLAPADLQSTITSTSDGHTLTPPINNGSALIGAGADIPSRTTPSTGFAQSRGLQLGGSKANTKAIAAQLAERVAAEEGGNDTWANNNDLMDVNADEGDWSKSSYLLECTMCSLSCPFFRCV